MADRMSAMFERAFAEMMTTLILNDRRPSLDLTRALRAQLAASLNRARLIGLLHHQDPRTYAAPALDSSCVTGEWLDDADTLPSGR